MPLTINVVEERFDNLTQEFSYPVIATLVLEHSLISISKWEAKWHKAYLEDNDKTPEEMMDYVRCMSLKGNIEDSVLIKLTRENYKTITDYINDPMTATTFKKELGGAGKSNNYISSELIYAKMVGYRIPVEFEKWHLNRLLTLIKVLDEQNKEPKKRSEREIARDYARIREANRAKMNAKRH